MLNVNCDPMKSVTDIEEPIEAGPLANCAVHVRVLDGGTTRFAPVLNVPSLLVIVGAEVSTPVQCTTLFRDICVRDIDGKPPIGSQLSDTASRVVDTGFWFTTVTDIVVPTKVTLITLMLLHDGAKVELAVAVTVAGAVLLGVCDEGGLVLVVP